MHRDLFHTLIVRTGLELELATFLCCSASSPLTMFVDVSPRLPARLGCALSAVILSSFSFNRTFSAINLVLSSIISTWSSFAVSVLPFNFSFSSLNLSISSLYLSLVVLAVRKSSSREDTNALFDLEERRASERESSSCVMREFNA